MGELGILFTPSERFPLTVDLAAQGYAGRREGLLGSLRVTIEF
jgi:hypothetical protein